MAQGPPSKFELIPAVLVGIIGFLFVFQGVRGLRGLSFYLPRSLRIPGGPLARLMGVLSLLFGLLMLWFAYGEARS
jgi:uncharacterized membrane protein HdeD (DUF308 family)